MAFVNPFLNSYESYDRDFDVIGNYVKQTAMYLSKMTGDAVEQCTGFIHRVIGPGGIKEITDPKILRLHRQSNGDRVKEATTFTEYLKTVYDNALPMAPTLTVYRSPKVTPSLLSLYIHGNIIGRAQVKAEAITAKMLGNSVLHNIKENEQTTFKIFNNALSGAQSSPYTIVYNKTAHPSLTSTCRTATSYGNANNEKFISGNRHYHNPDVVVANILSTVLNTDLALVQQCVDTYGLHYPTAEEALECVTRSSDLYWINANRLSRIRTLLTNLTPIERAAFVYVGDLWHLAKHNDGVVRLLLEELSVKESNFDLDVDHVKNIKGMDPDMKAFVSLLCFKELKARQISKVVEDNDVDAIHMLSGTYLNKVEWLDKYRLLVKALWVTNNVPASVYQYPNSLRRNVLGSDTDSSLFTVQEWVEWYQGDLSDTDAANGIFASVVYLSTQCIIHVLAKLSVMMGVSKENLHMLAMKNEYAFYVFVITSMAKHYYAYQGAKEGNVFAKMEKEIKGVGLKDSNIPKDVMARATKFMCEVMDKAIKCEQFDIDDVLRMVATEEAKVIDTIRRGKADFLMSGNIKQVTGYTNRDPNKDARYTTPYFHYEMWKDVWGPKYGAVQEPPYQCIKVNLAVNNRTDFQAWLNGIEDLELRMRIDEFLKRSGKTIIKTIWLPKPVIDESGIPQEIIDGMDLRRLVFGIVKPFYHVFESLGIYTINKNITTLSSDYYDVDQLLQAA